MAEYEGFPQSKVFMIPNGVDTLRFKPNDAFRGRLRDELNLPADAKLIGIVAALREEKNHSQLVLAARDILREHRHHANRGASSSRVCLAGPSVFRWMRAGGDHRDSLAARLQMPWSRAQGLRK